MVIQVDDWQGLRRLSELRAISPSKLLIEALQLKMCCPRQRVGTSHLPTVCVQTAAHDNNIHYTHTGI